ncbi:MAG: hypothetical protein DBX05_06725 [Candidatus Poseidoniales archaeon]|nr:MAG: hypothetical protein DBX05_06725 [Candidatus Poseidoniales archaeon]CAI8176489.1 MAG: Uncharacterised protein [Euryarchaeota archaeon]
MSWDWEWASRIERRIAIDELMASLVELVHEIESNLGESPWAIDPIIEAGLRFSPEGQKIREMFEEKGIPIEAITRLQSNVMWNIVYDGLSYLLSKEGEVRTEAKCFHALQMRFEKKDSIIRFMGYKVEGKEDDTSRRDIIKALFSSDRLSKDTMEKLLDSIDSEDEDSECLDGFEVGMTVMKKSGTETGFTGWPPFADKDEFPIIERIDTSDSTLLLKFKDTSWWINASLVEPSDVIVN